MLCVNVNETFNCWSFVINNVNCNHKVLETFYKLFTIFIRRIAICNFVRKLKSAINGKSHNILCISNIMFDLVIISTMVTTVSYLYDLKYEEKINQHGKYCFWMLVWSVTKDLKTTFVPYIWYLESAINWFLTKSHLIIIHFLWKYFRLVYCFLCTLLL